MKDAYDFNLDLLEVNGIEHIDGYIKEIDEIGRIKLETMHKDTDYSKCLKKLHNLGKKNLNDVECDEIQQIINEASKNSWKEIKETALLLMSARNNYYDYYCNLGTDLCIDMSNYNSRALDTINGGKSIRTDIHISNYKYLHRKLSEFIQDTWQLYNDRQIDVLSNDICQSMSDEIDLCRKEG